MPLIAPTMKANHTGSAGRCLRRPSIHARRAIYSAIKTKKPTNAKRSVRLGSSVAICAAGDGERKCGDAQERGHAPVDPHAAQVLHEADGRRRNHEHEGGALRDLLWKAEKYSEHRNADQAAAEPEESAHTKPNAMPMIKKPKK